MQKHKYKTIQRNTIHSATWQWSGFNDTLQNNAKKHDAILDKPIQYNAGQWNTMQWPITLYNTVHDDVIQCKAMGYNTFG